jgi:hypothetical protein
MEIWNFSGPAALYHLPFAISHPDRLDPDRHHPGRLWSAAR